MIVNSGEALPEFPMTKQVVSDWSCKRVYTHTNDDVRIAGLDIRDLNSHTTVGEEEIICERMICRQQSDQPPDEAHYLFSLTSIQVLAVGGTIEIP